MVLALPILLFVMALIVNYGTVASWKVRGETVARNAVWSTRSPRNGGAMPRPEDWPTTASIAVNSAMPNIIELDDPRVHLPVARGPLPFGAVVNEQLLDPARGLREGSSQLTRTYPLLQKLPQYTQRSQTDILDDKFQYNQMGLGSNWQRRMPVLYQLPKADPSLVQKYVAAVMAILNAPFRDDLAPLDRDPEFLQFRGSAPDFHPRLQQFCDVDQDVAKRQVDNLVDRIQGKVNRDNKGQAVSRVSSVAERMAGAFIGLYRSIIQMLQQAVNPNVGLIKQYQAEIDVLMKFLELLRNGG